MNTFNTTIKIRKQGDNGKTTPSHNYSAACPNVADMKLMGDRNLVGPELYVNYHTNIAYTGLMPR